MVPADLDGHDVPETAIDALYQVATGAGFDANGDANDDLNDNGDTDLIDNAFPFDDDWIDALRWSGRSLSDR